MKCFFKARLAPLVGVIALAAVIGFSMAACGGDDNDGGGGSLSGTYRYDAGAFGWAEITFSGSNFNMNGSIFGMSISAKGTYTVSETTLTTTTTESSGLYPNRRTRLSDFI